ncbi:MAG TPA: type II toxin-antitoxin system VapC family toxin [Solirubrobacterales bacterium]|nr:type II toxin-antitoxin system VapC family toxin [Solirubrobacterales bacterium]
MVIDTSALMAILLGEPERDEFIQVIANHPDPIISAATMVEASLVAESRLGTEGKALLDDFLQAGGIRTVAFDETQADLAHEAWKKYGRGNSPAGLNFGDCLSYSLAKRTDRPLLFKGSDFTNTDLRSALDQNRK